VVAQKSNPQVLARDKVTHSKTCEGKSYLFGRALTALTASHNSATRQRSAAMAAAAAAAHRSRQHTGRSTANTVRVPVKPSWSGIPETTELRSYYQPQGA
jgi:hypothetical protein